MSIEEVTMALTSMALDAGQMRQAAIASNIANANTTGYVPLAVSFEDQLDAARRNLQLGGGVQMDSLTGVGAQITAMPTTSSGQGFALDTEVAKLVTGAVHFQTLLKGMANHYSMLQMAVTEGKK